MGIYYFIGLIFFLFKDYKYAKKVYNDTSSDYISLSNENRIFDRLIDTNIGDF